MNEYARTQHPVVGHVREEWGPDPGTSGTGGDCACDLELPSTSKCRPMKGEWEEFRYKARRVCVGGGVVNKTHPYWLAAADEILYPLLLCPQMLGLTDGLWQC